MRLNNLLCLGAYVSEAMKHFSESLCKNAIPSFKDIANKIDKAYDRRLCEVALDVLSPREYNCYRYSKKYRVRKKYRNKVERAMARMP